MKRLLSITLAVAMVMSLFCVVPASATMIGSTYHYVFEDFEDGEKSIGASGGTMEVVDADNGSSKAVKFTFENATQYPAITIPDKFGMRADFTEDMILRGSVRYKLGTPLSKGSLTLLTVNKGDGNYYGIHNIANLTDTENWYTAEFEIPNFQADAESVMFQLRVGDSGACSTQAAEGDTVEIYFDDLQITREKNTDREKLTMCDRSAGCFNWSASTKTSVVDPLDSSNYAFRVTPSSNGGLYNLIYFQYKDCDVAYEVGDTITVSLDVLVEEMTYEHDLGFRLYPRSNDATAISEVGTSYYTKKYLGAQRGQWQTIVWKFEVTAAGNGEYMPYIYLSTNEDTNKEDDGRVDMGHYIYYFDNLTVEVSDRSGSVVPSVAISSAEMASDGTVAAAYTYSETAVEGVEAGTDVSLLKVKKANGAVVASAVAGGSLVVPEAYRNEDLTLEILPVSSVGTFGDDVVTLAVTKETASTIDEISIAKTAGGITVATNVDLPAAKLIFVTYDANGMMTDFDLTTTVTLSAQGTQEYPIPAGFESATVMLWYDMTDCKPLTDVLR